MNHGTLTCYVHHKCRCPECARASWLYAKRRRWDGPRTVPSDEVRAHVESLLAAGMTRKAIAEAAGCSDTVIVRLLGTDYYNKPTKRLQRPLAARILAVRYSPTAVAKIPSQGTRLRIQALVALGHEQLDISRRTGISPATMRRIMRQTTVRRTTADTIRRVYDDLAMIPGTSSRARYVARSKGWLVPLALDDDRLDDPSYTPDVAAIRTPSRGPKVAPIEDIAELHAQGVKPEAIAQRLGLNAESVARALRRLREAS